MHVLLRCPTCVFDYLQHVFETRKSKRIIAAVLAVVFLIALALIELKRLGLLSPRLSEIVPANHFRAINLGFTLLLGFETLDLVFAVPASVSRSVGKQIEVLSLILLRNTFKELVYFDVPAEISHSVPGVGEIVCNAGAAILLFVVLGIFYHLRPKPCHMSEDDKIEFISLKKCVALVIFLIFAVIAGFYAFSPHLKWDVGEIFQSFFTCLIFSDILLVLVSLRYLPVYHALFRNSAYAVATLLIRLALVAPPFYGAGISAVAALLILAIAWSYSKFAESFKKFGG
jgi:hypothetical protein